MDSKSDINYLKAWLLFCIAATIGGFLAGGAVGFLTGSILGTFEVGLQGIKTICGILGFLAGIPISFVCFKWCVKRFIVPQVRRNGQISDASNMVKAI